jgi:membrane fusion protein (multidrug efflux system)
VFFVSPEVDAAARRLIMKAWIANQDHRLKPGMFVNVDVEIAKLDSALMLPESSVVYDRHGVFVWRADEDGKAEKIPIELGIRQAGRVEVKSGLAVGDRVVSAGTHKLSAGTPIHDIRDATQPAQAQDGAATTIAGDRT